MTYLTCLAKNYPDRAQTIDIGSSVEGRTLKVIKVGRPHQDGSAKPAIWIDGGIHAREWISPSSVEYVVYQLVENKKLALCDEEVNTDDVKVVWNFQGDTKKWFFKEDDGAIVLLDQRNFVTKKIYMMMENN